MTSGLRWCCGGRTSSREAPMFAPLTNMDRFATGATLCGAASRGTPVMTSGLLYRPVMASEKLRLGGMALRNGLLIHGPTHWAAAVRTPDGEVEVASERKPELAPKLARKVPGLRGPLKLFEAMAVLPLVRRRMPAARLPFEDWRVLASFR